MIFSSRIIPGNEKAIGRLQNELARLGVEIVTELDHFVHVSGHPAREELVRMYQMIRPKVAIPVHGEARHLMANAAIAGECQIPHALVIENGDLVRLGSSNAVIVDEVPVGRLTSDGKTLLPLDGSALKDRRRIMFNGSVVATLVLNAARPTCGAAGHHRYRLGRAGRRTAGGTVLCGRLSSGRSMNLPPAARRDDDAVGELARRVLRRAINERFGKRSLVEIQVVRV